MFQRLLGGLLGGPRDARLPAEVEQMLGVMISGMDQELGRLIETTFSDIPNAAVVQNVNLPAMIFEVPDGQFGPDLVPRPIADLVQGLRDVQWWDLLDDDCPFAEAIDDLAELGRTRPRCFCEFEEQVKLMTALVESIDADLTNVIAEFHIPASNLRGVRRLIALAKEVLAKAAGLQAGDQLAEATYLVTVSGVQKDVDVVTQQLAERLQAVTREFGPLKTRRFDPLQGMRYAPAIIGRPISEELMLPMPDVSLDPSTDAVSGALASVLRALKNNARYAGVYSELASLAEGIRPSAADFQRQGFGSRIVEVLADLKTDLSDEDVKSPYVVLNRSIARLEEAVAEIEAWQPAAEKLGGRCVTLRVIGPAARVKEVLDRASAITRQAIGENVPALAARYGWEVIGEGDELSLRRPRLKDANANGSKTNDSEPQGESNDPTALAGAAAASGE